jgi:hypothetical protein
LQDTSDALRSFLMVNRLEFRYPMEPTEGLAVSTSPNWKRSGVSTPWSAAEGKKRFVWTISCQAWVRIFRTLLFLLAAGC